MSSTTPATSSSSPSTVSIPTGYNRPGVSYGFNGLPPHPSFPLKKTWLENLGWGCYPEGYDRRVHGPYDPARYYGPKDTPFGEVKLRDLPEWIGRRDKSPRAIQGLFSRAISRWKDKFAQPHYAGPAFLFQIVAGCSLFFYLINYHKTLIHHREYKYHW